MLTIELARVPVEIRCRYPANERFFAEYLSDREPLFVIEPQDTDLEQTRLDFEKTAEAEGQPKPRYSRAFLENNAIHALLAERLLDQRVLLMHGSALCMDGQGYLFTAPSGTGKSTHSRFWRETFGDRVWMINDDKPLLRIEQDGSVRVYGTPWNGKHHLSRNDSAPLRAIIHLTRSETNSIEPLAKADAFPVLMSQCYSSHTAARMLRVLELEKALLQNVDFYTLRCNLDPEAARVAWAGLSRGGPQTTSIL